MDRDEWFKSITKFTHLGGALNNNKQIILFGVHDSHFDPDAMDIMVKKHTYTFIIDSGNSIKTNRENSANLKIKAL